MRSAYAPFLLRLPTPTLDLLKPLGWDFRLLSFFPVCLASFDAYLPEIVFFFADQPLFAA